MREPVRALVFLLLLVACGDQGADTRRLQLAMVPLAEVRDQKNCGPDVLQNFGCWRQIDATGGCKVMVERPRDTGDRERLATLGLEVFKCWTGSKEY